MIATSGGEALTRRVGGVPASDEITAPSHESTPGRWPPSRSPSETPSRLRPPQRTAWCCPPGDPEFLELVAPPCGLEDLRG